MKRKDLIPGNLITRKITVYDRLGGYLGRGMYEPREELERWMIIACVPDMSKKHARKKLLKDALRWKLVIINVETGQVIDDVISLRDSSNKWKRLYL